MHLSDIHSERWWDCSRKGGLHGLRQLRARSKAADAGLMDGDEVMSVNGCGCKDVSYERLVDLVEHAGHYLDLDIVRCASRLCVCRTRHQSLEQFTSKYCRGGSTGWLGWLVTPSGAADYFISIIHKIIILMKNTTILYWNNSCIKAIYTFLSMSTS